MLHRAAARGCYAHGAMGIVRRRYVAALAVAVLMVTGTVVGVTRVASEDPLAPCDTLVVLNGHHPVRVDEGLGLYRDGIGREIWLTSDPKSSDERGDRGTRSNRERLLAAGVADDVIRLVPGAASSTRAELALVVAELRRRARSCAVVVTSSIHGPRVRVTWRRLAGSAPRAIVRTANDASAFNARSRWAERGATLLAWLGFPR